MEALKNANTTRNIKLVPKKPETQSTVVVLDEKGFTKDIIYGVIVSALTALAVVGPKNFLSYLYSVKGPVMGVLIGLAFALAIIIKNAKEKSLGTVDETIAITSEEVEVDTNDTNDDTIERRSKNVIDINKKSTRQLDFDERLKQQMALKESRVNQAALKKKHKNDIKRAALCEKRKKKFASKLERGRHKTEKALKAKSEKPKPAKPDKTAMKLQKRKMKTIKKQEHKDKRLAKAARRQAKKSAKKQAKEAKEFHKVITRIRRDWSETAISSAAIDRMIEQDSLYYTA